MKKNVIALAVATALAMPVLAQTNEKNEPSLKDVEKISVRGVRERLSEAGLLKDTVQKTEMVSGVTIARLQAANLTEAISISPGVRVNNECSMCGVKRVMLNGLRGEQTTVLVDGLPVYTMMSGFYGLDAATSSGYDVAYIYGPLRGREAYTGLSVTF